MGSSALVWHLVKQKENNEIRPEKGKSGLACVIPAQNVLNMKNPTTKPDYGVSLLGIYYVLVNLK